MKNISKFTALFLLFFFANNVIAQYKKLPKLKGDSIVYDRFDTLSNAYVPYGKQLYTYNGSGNISIAISITWNKITNTWDNTSKYDYTYDNKGNNILQMRNIWNGSKKQWDNNYKEEFSFDTAGRNYLRIETKWNAQNSQWENYLKEEYKYDPVGNFIVSDQYSWNVSSGNWANGGEHVYLYDSKNNNNIEYQYVWNSNTNLLDFQYKWEYNYDSTDNLFLSNKFAWNKTNNMWDSSDRTVYTYNNAYPIADIWGYSSISKFKHMITSSSSQRLNKNNIWINNIKATYYYSAAVSGIEEHTIQPTNIYPNPTQGVIKIHSNASYIHTLHVFDIHGKLVYAENINKNQPDISIDLSNFNKGVYFINTLSENGALGVNKIIIE